MRKAQPPGFRGLDPDQRISIHTRHLPHWRQRGATYFVTFRLADALPQVRLNELESLRSHWEYTHPEPRSHADWSEYARSYLQRTEAWLDEECGACHFRETRWVEDLRGRLHHFQDQRYHLACWVIMPNHTHLVIRPFDHYELETLVGAMNGVVARRLNAALGRTDEVWQQESYDRIIRDVDHLERVIQYIGDNPAKAHLPREAWRRWIDPRWQAAGWDFRR